MVGRSKRHAEPDPGAPDREGLPKDRPRSVLRRIIGGALSYGVILVVFWSLLGKLREAQSSGLELAPITAGQVAVVTILGLVNTCTNLPPIILTLPGLRFREAFVTNTASSALSNTVPEGGAVATGLNFAMLRSWGFTLDRITSSYLTTGIWTNLCRYSLLALAMVALAATETVASWVPWVALGAMVLMVVAVVLLVLALHREAFAQRLGSIIGSALRPVMKLLRKPAIDDMDERVDSFRKLIAETAGNVWGSLTVTMLLSQFTAFVILGVALRMQGIDEATVSWSRIIVAWGGMSLASLIVPTPGGLGVAEAALAAILSPAIPDAQTANMVSAIMLFRGATWFLPIPIGSVSYLFWRKTKRWRRTAEDRYGVPDPDAGTGPGAPSAVVPAVGT
jgi:putative heme transporter